MKTLDYRPELENYVPQIPVKGRGCDGCAMCCKLSAVGEMEKPAGVWCRACSTRKGCDIYETRPQICRTYYCHFILSTLGEEWRPSTCKFMLTVIGDLMVVSVDPIRPDAWKQEPYFKNLKKWSETMRVQVNINQHTYALFPDHIDDLGIVDDDHFVATIEEPTPLGTVRRAIKIHKKDLPEGTGEGSFTIR